MCSRRTDRAAPARCGGRSAQRHAPPHVSPIRGSQAIVFCRKRPAFPERLPAKMALAQVGAVVFLLRSCSPPRLTPSRAVRPPDRRAVPRRRCAQRAGAGRAADRPHLVAAAPDRRPLRPACRPHPRRPACRPGRAPPPSRRAPPAGAQAEAAAGCRLAGAAGAGGRGQRRAVAAPAGRPGNGGADRRSRPADAPHPGPALPDAENPSAARAAHAVAAPARARPSATGLFRSCAACRRTPHRAACAALPPAGMAPALAGLSGQSGGASISFHIRNVLRSSVLPWSIGGAHPRLRRRRAFGVDHVVAGQRHGVLVARQLDLEHSCARAGTRARSRRGRTRTSGRSARRTARRWRRGWRRSGGASARSVSA